MDPADEVVSDITLHFCLLKNCCCDENPAVRGGYGYIMVKLVGCGPGLWAVLLQVSWAWNMSNIPSINALIFWYLTFFFCFFSNNFIFGLAKKSSLDFGLSILCRD